MQPNPNLQPTIFIPVAATILALALADGGFSDESVGVATAAVWLLLGGLLVGGRLRADRLRGPLALAAGLLAGLAGWTALSIGWAGDSGAAFVDLVRALFYLGSFLLIGLAARAGSGPSWLAGIALGGSLVAVVAIGARLAGLGVDQALAVELPAAAERLSYPLGYWNALGYLMAMALTALAWVAANGRGSVDRAAAAASVPVALALFLTSSRGALLAAAVGLIAVVWASTERDRLWLAAIASVPAWAVTIVLAAVLRPDLDPFAGVTTAGVAIGAVLVAACGLVYFEMGSSRIPGGRLRSRAAEHGRAALALAMVLIAAVAVVAGPSSFIGDFRTERGGEEIGTATEALVSGSGRSSFWEAALSAFSEDPVRGLGAGGFENYWNANGDIDVPIRNAHSAPLETLAELGLVGGIALLALLGVAAAALIRSAREARPGQRGMLGAFAGLLGAGLVAVSIDWTWQMAAAAAPLLIALAVLCSEALRPGTTGEELLAAPETEPLAAGPAPASVSAPALGLAAAAVALVAVWAGTILALSAVQLDRSESELQRGDLAAAAESARAAARLQPWSPEPSLRLASIEQAATNLEAARRRAEEAARLAPDDFRPWLLLAAIHADLGNLLPASAYGERAGLTGGAVLEQAEAGVP